MTEEEEIRRAANGEAAAMQILYERYAARVYAVVRRLSDDEESARDCEQETWVAAFRGLRDFRGDAGLSTWLHRIAINAALQGRRREARHTHNRTGMHEPEVGRIEAPGESDESILQRLDLERALARMPRRMREILLLHDVEGMKHEEIAVALAITDGASRSQLFKARVRLRTLLNGETEIVSGDES